MKRAVIYVRVSTDQQTVSNQTKALEEWATKADVEIVHVYADNGVSGSKGRDQRPGLDAMLTAVTRREFDIVLCWSVDRLGRSVQHLVSILQELHGAGVDLYLHQQAIDTRTPAGRALFQIMGVFAEFERAMIVERVRAGLSRAKAQGKVLGRKPISAKTERKILKLRDKGYGVKKCAKLAGVGVGTAQRVIRAGC
jgi:DNA invertase Pin-like site-specific DNA recombinase